MMPYLEMYFYYVVIAILLFIVLFGFVVFIYWFLGQFRLFFSNDGRENFNLNDQKNLLLPFLKHRLFKTAIIIYFAISFIVIVREETWLHQVLFGVQPPFAKKINIDSAGKIINESFTANIACTYQIVLILLHKHNKYNEYKTILKDKNNYPKLRIKIYDENGEKFLISLKSLEFMHVAVPQPI